MCSSVHIADSISEPTCVGTSKNTLNEREISIYVTNLAIGGSDWCSNDIWLLGNHRLV